MLKNKEEEEEEEEEGNTKAHYLALISEAEH